MGPEPPQDTINEEKPCPRNWLDYFPEIIKKNPAPQARTRLKIKSIADNSQRSLPQPTSLPRLQIILGND